MANAGGKRGSIAGAVKNLTAEEQLQLRDEKLQECALWEHVNARELHKITKQNVDEMFNLFDAEGSGEISLEELMEIKKVQGLLLTNTDLKTLCEDADKEQTGMITSAELHRALTQGEVSFNMLRKSLNPDALTEFKPTVCSINELLEFLNSDYDTRESLWSLPLTISIVSSFLVATSFHFSMLYSWEYHWLVAIPSNIADIGLDYMFDIPGIFYYLSGSFVTQRFFQDLNTYPPGRYFGNSQIMGGFRLRRRHTLPDNDVNIPEYLANIAFPFPLYGVRYYGRGEVMNDDRFLLYHEREDLVRERIQNMSQEYWLDMNTTSFSVDAIYLNPMLNVFCFEEMRFTFQRDGFLRRQTFHETFLADPYISAPIGFADVVFLLLTCRVLYQEIKQVVPAVQGGLDSFLNYFEFWSIVDWISIIWGLTCSAVWCIVVIKVYALHETLATYPTAELDAIVLENKTFLSEREVNIVASHEQLYEVMTDMFDSAQDVAMWHSCCRILAVVYIAVLMLKFFKGFRANARLNVVIETLSSSAVDVGHFFIVFFAVFCCYAWAGHVMFGTNDFGYSTLMKALFMRWTTVLGEEDTADLIPAGVFISFVYTLSYEFLVTNIILGILLGLVFEAYGRVQAETDNPPTIFQQVAESIRNLSETSDFIDQWELILALEDDDEPAHPSEIVTVRSLKQAFVTNGMTKDNAEYLIKKASEFAATEFKEPELELDQNLQVTAQLKTICLKAIRLSESVLELLKQESRKPQEMRYDAIMQGYDPDDPADVQALINKKLAEDQDNMSFMPEARVATNNTLTGPQDTLRSGTDQSGSKESASDGNSWNDEQLSDKVRQVFDVCSAIQDEHREATSEVKQELQQYQHSTRTLDLFFQQELDELTALFETCDVGVSNLVVCFDGSDLQSIQELPERLHHLVSLARDSRESLAKSNTGAASSGSDPLQRLELRISQLRTKIDELTQTADAQDEMCEALARVKMSIRELADEFAE